ncbi:MAG: putative LPS assembly protein LptD [candidate division WOR-3 bacterium]
MRLLLLLLVQPLPDTALTAPDTGKVDIVYYGARLVRFLAREERVVLLDSAWVRYRDMSVYADSITYDIRRHTLSAVRKSSAGESALVRFRTATEQVTGTELHYNVDTRRGMMRHARSQVENGWISAREVWLVRERVLNALNADYTTCDLPHPHYAFFGPRVKLFMDDVAIAEPVILRLGRIPVLPAPFWLVPVASKRKSGLMPFKVGSATDQGYYAKGISYYWVLNDYADITFLADIMTRRGVQFRTEGIYIVNPYSRGSVQGSYIREFWNPANPDLVRYSFNLSTASKITPLTDLDIQAELISDTAYAPDYAEDRLDWLKQEVYSYGALTHRFRGVGRANLRAERHTYYMRHYDYQLLPAASISFNTRTLPLGWNITPAAGFSRRMEKADSAGTDTLRAQRLTPSLSFNLTSPSYPIGTIEISDRLNFSDSRRSYRNAPFSHTQTLNNELGLGTSQKLIGIFNTSEAVSWNWTDNLTDTLLPEPRLTFSLGSGFSLFRVFSTRALSLAGILHTVSPNLQFYYEPKITPGGVFGRPDLLHPNITTLQFFLRNGFQAKRATTKEKFDLGTVNFSTGYDLRQHRLSPVYATISTRPLLLIPGTDSGPVRRRFDLNLDGNLGFRPESLRLSDDYQLLTSFSWAALRTDTVHHRENGLELRLNHTLGKNLNMLTGSVSFSFAGWRLGLNSIGYNFTRRQLTDYSITLWRDLHCWEALGTVSGLGKQWRWDFEVRIKKLPDVRFGKSLFRTFLP